MYDIIIINVISNKIDIPVFIDIHLKLLIDKGV